MVDEDHAEDREGPAADLVATPRVDGSMVREACWIERLAERAIDCPDNILFLGIFESGMVRMGGWMMWMLRKRWMQRCLNGNDSRLLSLCLFDPEKKEWRYEAAFRSGSEATSEKLVQQSAVFVLANTKE